MKRYWEIREKIRENQFVTSLAYLLQGMRARFDNQFAKTMRSASAAAGSAEGVALCIRIRDEAPNLRELVEYYLAAGVRHIFFYEARSTDDFHSVLDPFVQSGDVTLIENWPHVPISPAAEHDCALRCVGKYAWMGCVDADEFVVVANHQRIDDVLAALPASQPALALHWRFFGSGGHIQRPQMPVIAAYTLREQQTNRHVKLFLRPERAVLCRNSHSWYFTGFLSAALNERGERVLGSTHLPAASEKIWINHYYHKSMEEFQARGRRVSVLDKVGIQFNSRTPERGADYESHSNAVKDLSAVSYHLALCQRQGCSVCAALILRAPEGQEVAESVLSQ